MAEVFAIGSLIGAKVASAGAAVGHAVGSAFAAHPFLMGGATLGAGLSAYSSVSAGSAARRAASQQSQQAVDAGKSQLMQLQNLQAQNRLAYEGERTQAAIESQQRQKRLQSLMATQVALFGSGNVDVTGVDAILTNSYDSATTEQGRANLSSNMRLGALNAEFANLGLEMGNTNVGTAQATSRLTSQGNSAFKQGLLKAGSSLLDFGVSTAQLGSVPSKKPKPVKLQGLQGDFGNTYNYA
jgi:hypothetical protein